MIFFCNGVTVEELNSAKMSAIEFIFKYTFNVFKGQRGKIDIGIVNKVYN